MALQLRYPEEADFHSRTFVDVDEAATASNATAIFRWSPSVRADLAARNETYLSPTRLIVATGAEASEFARSLSSEAPVVGTLVLSSTPIVHTTFASGPSAVCAIVALTPETLLAIAPLDVADNDVWTFVDALFANIQPQEVISMSTLMSVTYDADLHDGCVLYQLATGAPESTPVPVLPAPRFVTGVPAALLTHSALRRRRAVVYITLQHPTTSLLATARCLTPLLPLLGLQEPTAALAAATSKSFENLYL
ncbi:hypothetical protein ACHHYP_04056 [Achlya hypogyna]|uniref:Proteasome assembly chaperone 1 n=1 Tax=Achlya hypogyna TaxID=1202772 RepID=A0A1V9Z2I8_ACHHY|nr:hypothetical protein ACHHYP_04056 [Achlya hypogyna]